MSSSEAPTASFDCRDMMVAVRRGQRSRRVRFSGLVAALATMAVPFAPPAGAQDLQQGVGTTAEAWYSSAPTCQLPTGCSPVPLPVPNAYPADTLHVAQTAGQQTARTYVTLDTGSLPSRSVLTGAQLTLPVAGSDAGTQNQSAATLQVCLVTGTVEPASGSLASGPAADCTVSSPAVYVAQPGQGEFTVDLGPFVSHWSAGTAASVAILPTPEGAATATSWRVAFSGRDRSTPDAAPITATLTYRALSPSPSGSVATGGVFPVSPTAPAAVRDVLPTSGISVAPGQVAAPASQAGAASGSATTARRVVPVVGRSVPFAYPVVLFLPLVLVMLGGYFGRALSAEVRVPVRRTTAPQLR